MIIVFMKNVEMSHYVLFYLNQNNMLNIIKKKTKQNKIKQKQNKQKQNKTTKTTKHPLPTFSTSMLQTCIPMSNACKRSKVIPATESLHYALFTVTVIFWPNHECTNACFTKFNYFLACLVIGKRTLNILEYLKKKKKKKPLIIWIW